MAEILVGTVIGIGGQQLLAAQQPHGVEIVRGHQVLPGFAAGQREQSHTGSPTARFVGQQPAVFIVGMGGNHEQAGARVQFEQTLPQRCRPAIEGQRPFRNRGFQPVRPGNLGSHSSKGQNQPQQSRLPEAHGFSHPIAPQHMVGRPV